MLKLLSMVHYYLVLNAAAFGRLCVETALPFPHSISRDAAAFGRLCVETCIIFSLILNLEAAAFGRLCVETFR